MTANAPALTMAPRHHAAFALWRARIVSIPRTAHSSMPVIR